MSSFNYDRYDRRQSNSRNRSALGFYVPLILTVTVATAGLAAWVWSAREDGHDYSSDDDLSYGEDGAHERRNGKAPMGRDLSTGELGGEAYGSDGTLLGRAQGVIRRTPSPQQFFDTVSKKTAAGWAAAGAAAGAALASIREEDKDEAFGDHSRWSEEATIRRNVEAQSRDSGAAVDSQARSFAASMRKAEGRGDRDWGKRKTVVLVVSAESLSERDLDDDSSYREETAVRKPPHHLGPASTNRSKTILSHLPDTDFSRTKLFVLIYSPSLRSRPQSRANSRTGSSSLGDSYSAISTPARTPGEELNSIEPVVYTPAPSARGSDTTLWNTLHSQALHLVEDQAMVMPFNTTTGFVHMLRHIGPDLVYVVDALSGVNGQNIDDVRKWVGQTIVVVGGDGTGLGGLVDTDDEGPARRGKESEHTVRWWQVTDIVGLGKGVEVVDASRLTDDYERRVGGRE
ncbi:microbody biogenesis protein peroxin 22-like protein [Stemphylium lycopersici]|uniref:Microbody biogenesis protein peroxin 22-like protein n=1 Tax=Stemphylium lycopersici TaxID=183478 RepID=A0A364N3V6_STELY|nr:microbody biogenesis protein peroxin 22-like protein [Stemphylium lycopersici]RAR11370.1 microbody biogenesis protein peroxin 22-like protein [Stemphylium lycopersici]